MKRNILILLLAMIAVIFGASCSKLELDSPSTNAAIALNGTKASPVEVIEGTIWRSQLLFVLHTENFQGEGKSELIGGYVYFKEDGKALCWIGANYGGQPVCYTPYWTTSYTYDRENNKVTLDPVTMEYDGIWAYIGEGEFVEKNGKVFFFSGEKNLVYEDQGFDWDAVLKEAGPATVTVIFE